MDVGSDNRITKVVEKELIANIKEEYTNPVANAAVYLIKKEILDFVPSNSPFDFPKDLFPLLIEKGIPCFGFSIGEGYRIDIGTIPHYYNTHLAILEGKIDFDLHFPILEERVWVGSKSTIGPGSNIGRPVLICENSRIGSNTSIECSIIGNAVEIGRGSSIRKSIVLDSVHVGDGVSISHSIIGENCFIEDGVSLPANTVLGNYCRLGGTQLTMREKDFLGLIRG
jgi:mannose-1-phosphate guanylyltransferase/phosphomannomutase